MLEATRSDPQGQGPAARQISGIDLPLCDGVTGSPHPSWPPVSGRAAKPQPACGSKPTSVAVSGTLVYVLNNGTPNITGFHLADGELTALAGSARPLSSADADPAQISFTPDGGALIATERGTNSISSYVINQRGYAQGPATIKSSGQTPYGFALTKNGSLIVSEAFGGATGPDRAGSGRGLPARRPLLVGHRDQRAKSRPRRPVIASPLSAKPRAGRYTSEDQCLRLAD